MVTWLDKAATVLCSGTQRYEQFLQVGRLDQALILCGVWLYLLRASVSSVLMVLYILNIFVTFFTLSLTERSLVGLALTCLSNHCSSVL